MFGRLSPMLSHRLRTAHAYGKMLQVAEPTLDKRLPRLPIIKTEIS